MKQECLVGRVAAVTAVVVVEMVATEAKDHAHLTPPATPDVPANPAMEDPWEHARRQG